ncbi:hypothetical protein [Vitiosangium sp. GDMCC 1.1324]|uniref:hypothetical protein n=1 Tax=Vitiosangium sp. (strain GDMCC 1.1324) TaxID=2138576 RepID=UPI000D36CB69|nr:hypothetical protein [Vitiosangium sp. GDMCC 1.1324]PTL83189.1 hypothetical protein DAT35_14410 [Vitiosangium sp. GDMCC 1.1324]
MSPRKLIVVIALALSSCIRKWEPFSTRPEQDRTVIFPLSVGSGLVEIKPQEETYELDGEVLRALMLVSNDLFPPDTSKLELPCRFKPQAHTFRFARRGDVIFVYVNEDLAYCGRTTPALDSGAKYAISKDGRILRRVLDGLDEDDHVWSLETPDGGRVTVVTESSDSPTLEDLDRPDSGVLRVTTEPVTMPDVIVLKPIPGFVPIEVGPDFPLGNTMSPFDDAGTWQWRDGQRVPVPQASPPVPAPDLDGGTPDAGGDAGSPGDAGTSGLRSPPGPPDSGVGAP